MGISRSMLKNLLCVAFTLSIPCLAACTLPSTHRWAQEGWPQYADGYVLNSIFQSEMKQKFAVLGKEGSHTHTMTNIYKVAIPTDHLDEIKVLTAYAWQANSDESRRFLQERNIHSLDQYYHPFYDLTARWQDRKRLSFLHPLEERKLLDMSVDEEFKMYRDLGADEAFIHYLKKNERLPGGLAGPYFYDMDNQYLLFSIQMQDINGYKNETANEAHYFKVYYFEYATKKYGYWRVPIAYKDPKQWYCHSVMPTRYMSKFKDKIATTLFGCEPFGKEGEYSGLAIIHNLKTGQTFEAPVPGSFNNYYTFAPDKNSFYSFSLLKNLDRESPNWMQPEAHLTVLNVEKNEFKKYVWPIQYKEANGEIKTYE